MKEQSALPDLSDMTEAEFIAAARELCDSGLITCTRGEPGAADARYALAFFPLDNPGQFSSAIRKRHAVNMLRHAKPKGRG